MTQLPDVMSHLNAMWEAVKPYKEAIFGLVTVLGGAAAAFFGGYRRQAKRPEEALAQAASYSSTVTVTRIHQEDRRVLGDLNESVVELTRAIRHGNHLMEDQAETCARARRRSDPSAGGGGSLAL